MNSTTEPQAYIKLTPGDPAPWFNQRSTGNPNYAFHTAAGRYVVLCFYASAADAQGSAAIQKVLANRQRFDDDNFCFFGVSLDPLDEREGRVSESLPGIRFFWDFDGTASRLYGAIPRNAEPGKAPLQALRFWIVLDPTLRVLLASPLQLTAAMRMSFSTIWTSCRRPDVSPILRSRHRSSSCRTYSRRNFVAV